MIYFRIKKRDLGKQMRRATLRIKKIYFDQIASGNKTVEYRAVKPFYERMFRDDDINQIVFHYQAKRYLFVDVISIDKIKTPERLQHEFGDLVFAIVMNNPKVFVKWNA